MSKVLFASIVSSLIISGSVDGAELRRYLRLMDEPDLNSQTSNTNTLIFRLIRLPTWANPTAVRVQQDGKVFKLWAKRLDRTGSLIEQKERILSEAESRLILESIQRLDFFKMPARGKGDEAGLDGEDWTVEAVQNGKYHLVNRWTPDYDTEKRGLQEFVTFANRLEHMAGLKSQRQGSAPPGK